MDRYYFSIYGTLIEQYIETQRSMGYKPKDVNYVLKAFDRFATERDEENIGISKALADDWGKKRFDETEINTYKRIQMVRLFAVFLCKIGYPSYVARLPKFKSTFTPYIFTDKQISDLFEALDQMSVQGANKQAIFPLPVLFRFLYGTGLRISEALELTCDNVHLPEKYVVVRNSKNGFDRAVPLSDTLIDICKQYTEYRTCFLKPLFKPTNRFFVYSDGRNCNSYTVYSWFRKALYKAGIPHGGKGVGPRVQDLRHTFACHSLAHMSRSGLDMYYSLPILSSYLGHRSLAATDSYVRLTAQVYPDLAANLDELAPCLFPDLSQLNDDEAN